MELRHTLWLLLLCLQCFNGVGWVTGRHLAHRNLHTYPQIPKGSLPQQGQRTLTGNQLSQAHLENGRQHRWW